MTLYRIFPCFQSLVLQNTLYFFAHVQMLRIRAGMPIHEMRPTVLPGLLAQEGFDSHVEQYPEVLKQAMETYHIESSKMMRYARRRGKEDEMKKMLEEIEDAEA